MVGRINYMTKVKWIFLSIVCFFKTFSYSEIVNANNQISENKFLPLVEISSEYLNTNHKNSETPNWVKISGYGFIIKYTDRFFVTSVSHLTQGKLLTLKIAGSSGEIIQFKEPHNRIYDNDSDIEIIEILKPNANLDYIFEYNCNTCDYFFDYIQDETIKNSVISLSSDDFVKENLNKKYSIPIPQLMPKRLQSHLIEKIKLPENYRIEDYITGSKHTGKSWLNLDFNLKPGMSGLPLLARSKDTKGFELKGIARATLNHFNKSIFATEDSVRQLLVKLILKPNNTATTTNKSSTKWHYSDLVGNYRSYANGLLETNPSIKQTGGGDLTDSGGGDLTDSGEELIHDKSPDKNINSPPTLGMYSNQENSKIIAFQIEHHELPNGLSDGKDGNYLAETYSPSYFIYANHYGLALVDEINKISNNPSLINISYRGVDLDLESLFISRMQNIPQHKIPRLTLNESHCLIDFNAYKKTSQPNIRILITDPENQSKSILIQITKDYLSHEKFNPYIKINNKKFINIWGLFMVDALTLTSALNEPVGYGPSPESKIHDIFHKSILPKVTRSPYVYYSVSNDKPESIIFCTPSKDSTLFESSDKIIRL